MAAPAETGPQRRVSAKKVSGEAEVRGPFCRSLLWIDASPGVCALRRLRYRRPRRATRTHRGLFRARLPRYRGGDHGGGGNCIPALACGASSPHRANQRRPHDAQQPRQRRARWPGAAGPPLCPSEELPFRPSTSLCAPLHWPAPTPAQRRAGGCAALHGCARAAGHGPGAPSLPPGVLLRHHHAILARLVRPFHWAVVSDAIPYSSLLHRYLARHERLWTAAILVETLVGLYLEAVIWMQLQRIVVWPAAPLLTALLGDFFAFGIGVRACSVCGQRGADAQWQTLRLHYYLGLMGTRLVYLNWVLLALRFNKATMWHYSVQLAMQIFFLLGAPVKDRIFRAQARQAHHRPPPLR